MVELTEFIVKSLVSNPDMVSVKQFDDEDFITIVAMVSKDDMGKVIGKNGMIVKSIRTILQTSSYMQGLPKVKLEIDSF